MLLKTPNASMTVNKHLDILSTLVDVPTAFARSLTHLTARAMRYMRNSMSLADRRRRDCYSPIACEEIFLKSAHQEKAARACEARLVSCARGCSSRYRSA